MAVEKLTAAEFEAKVMHYPGTVVIDFWAEWCGPCMMLSSIMEELSEEVPAVKVMKCNVDEEMGLAVRFSLNSIPALLKFKNGKLVDQSIGYRPKAEIKAFLEA